MSKYNCSALCKTTIYTISMALLKREKKGKELEPVSFRLSVETRKQLNEMKLALNQSKAKIVEDALNEAYIASKKKYPKSYPRTAKK